ncbi:MAG: hypothetical protein J1F63_04840 [Oscillospiraceae bacterium]|nr:hypothetical protein [Oscillospiraceae bacterium]
MKLTKPLALLCAIMLMLTVIPASAFARGADPLLTLSEQGPELYIDTKPLDGAEAALPEGYEGEVYIGVYIQPDPAASTNILSGWYYYKADGTLSLTAIYTAAPLFCPKARSAA